MNNKTTQNGNEIVSGWGGSNSARVQVINPNTINQLQKVIRESSQISLIARGLGRSYGDAAQLNDGVVINLNAFQHIHLDRSKSQVTAGSGVSLDLLLKKIVPAGFFLPVTPGTRNVTIGGAIAADVHGKNHHLDGSFGNHVSQLIIVDGTGELKKLSPNNNASSEERNQFWATIGGMGLTGVVVEATFSLIPISTSLISVDTSRHQDLEELMDAMTLADNQYQYSVAWVDSLNRKGRGVLTCGDHAVPEQLGSTTKNKDPLHYDPKSLASAPSFLPNGLLNKLTVGAFNETWFRKSPKRRKEELQEIAPYFHPLDGVQDWNKIYGSKGFLQYQFAVPDSYSHLITHSLESLRKIGAPSFLTVLKRFGPENLSPLSFPIKGWTLASDIPLSVPNLEETLLKLDEKVAEAGGRIYLAKDSRQSATMFRSTYPKLNEWQNVQKSLDPNKIFCSDLAKRIQLI